MFVEPNRTEAWFMYRINRAGEVSHHNDVCTNYVAPLSPVVPEYSWSSFEGPAAGSALPYSPWCTLSCCRLEWAARLHKPLLVLEAGTCGGTSQVGRPLVRGDDWQSQYTLERAQRDFELREKQNKKQKWIIIILAGEQFWHVATCLLHCDRNAR